MLQLSCIMNYSLLSSPFTVNVRSHLCVPVCLPTCLLFCSNISTSMAAAAGLGCEMELGTPSCFTGSCLPEQAWCSLELEYPTTASLPCLLLDRGCVSGLGTAERVGAPSPRPELQPCCPVGTAGSWVTCRESTRPSVKALAPLPGLWDWLWPQTKWLSCAQFSVSAAELWHLGRAGMSWHPGRVRGARQGLLVATALWEGREGGREQLCLPVKLIFSCLLKSSVFLHLFV